MCECRQQEMMVLLLGEKVSSSVFLLVRREGNERVLAQSPLTSSLPLTPSLRKHVSD